MSARPALFLDRDGTIIRDTDYVAHPDEVELVPGAADAIRRLNRANVPVIVVTNQSGIARGLLTEQDLLAVQTRLVELLREGGAELTATYHCPHAPGDGGEPTCECRKPGTLLFHRAAREHHVQLERSVFAGDKWRDIAPALSLGGTGFLVPGDPTTPEDRQRAIAEARVAASLGDVADFILAEQRDR